MLKICLIDDEANARFLLRALLLRLAPDCIIIGEASCKVSAIDLLQRVEPDVVFMDINLGDGTCFDVLAALHPPQYFIVFATASNQFEIRAFQVNALDYLLKPINEDDLYRTLDKIRKYQLRKDSQKQIETLLTTVQQKKTEKLILHTAEKIYFIHIIDILRFESLGSYTRIETISGEKIVASAHLGHYEQLMSSFEVLGDAPNPFFRIHQSHIIRISKVKQMIKQPDGEYVVLDNGAKVPISRRRREAFLTVMNG